MQLTLVCKLVEWTLFHAVWLYAGWRLRKCFLTAVDTSRPKEKYLLAWVTIYCFCDSFSL